MRQLRWSLPPFIAAPLLVVVVGCSDDSPASLMAPESDPELSVAAAPLAFSRISVGTQHTCAITFENRAYCWGKNSFGAVGNGSSAFSIPRPSPVAGGLRFAQISTGTNYTCGVTTESKAYCWGDNWTGQLGDGTENSHPTPFPVAGGRKFRQIIAGFAHTCAVTPANEAFCWGRNVYGQVGIGTATIEQLTPAKVRGMHSWRRVIAGGNHTCGVTTGSRAFCWGGNDRGQLGINTFTGRTTPVAVSGGLSFVQVIAGANHSCGLTGEQRAYCWGDNEWGQIGDGLDRPQTLTPSPVLGTRRWRQVIAGFFHTCGVTMANVAFCWGFNNAGQNGNGTTTGTPVATRVTGGLPFAVISTGVQEPPPRVNSDAVHSCALTPDDRAYCWGGNAYGQLGTGTTSLRSPVPVAVVGPT